LRNIDKRGSITRSVIKQIKKPSPEYTIHKQIAEYLTYVLTPLSYFTTVENSNHTGGTIGMIKQAQDKAKGVKAGFPDILIIHDGKYYGLEIKRPGAHATDKQIEQHNKIRKAGGAVEIVRSIEDVQLCLATWQILTRDMIHSI